MKKKRASERSIKEKKKQHHCEEERREKEIYYTGSELPFPTAIKRQKERKKEEKIAIFLSKLCFLWCAYVRNNHDGVLNTIFLGDFLINV